LSSPAAGLRGGWGAGARAAGIVIALGYLLGFVRGPIVAVVGGLALVTLGRCASSSPPDDMVLGGSLAVLAGALGVGALRWGALDLGDLRGAQSVLGPTLLVGPGGAAAACWFAAAAGVTALATWLATARHADAAVAGGSGRIIRTVWIAEAVVGGFAIVSVFWGPSIARDSLTGGDALLALLGWVAAVSVVTAAAAGAALLLGPRSIRWRWGGLAVSAAAAVAAVVVVAGTVP
jgi:hypothetical protein